MLTAILAILLGALRLFGLTALGRALLRRRRAPWLTVPLAVLAAGAALGTMYASFLWVGWRDAALAIDGLAMLLAVVFRGRQTAMEIRRLFAPLLELGRRNRWTLTTSLVIAGVYAFEAVMPPRDPAALRYHLAHLAQIDREGRWGAMSIAHYAFPFAWQSTFLPFVHFHLAAGAQVVNAGAWAIALAAIVGQRGAAKIGTTGALLLALVALSPLAIGTATAPTADVFTLLAGLVVALLLAGHTPDASGAGFGEATALGFAAWVGVGTRYQAVAIGVATTIVAVIWLAHSDRWITLLGFVEGAVLAWLLAAPFFLANAVRFGDAVWPLRSTPLASDYPSTVGAHYADSWHGALSLPGLGASGWRLLTNGSAAPLPLLLVAVVVVAMIGRGPGARSARRVALFAMLVLATWVLAQPALDPRYSVYLAGAALLLGLRYAEVADAGRLRAAAWGILGAGAIALGSHAIAGVALDMRGLVAGGRGALRASTSYYPVYEWLDRQAPRDARILVIVRSGETFYLDRYYRRADPASSAEIEWPRVHDGAALAQRMRSRGFEYVVYDSASWGGAPGGEEMVAAIADAAARGILDEARRFELHLAPSGLRDAAIPATVIVYRLASDGASATSR